MRVKRPLWQRYIIFGLAVIGASIPCFEWFLRDIVGRRDVDVMLEQRARTSLS